MGTAPMGDLKEGQDGCQVPKSLKGSGGAVRTQERIRWARSKGIEARHVTWKALYSSFLFCFFFFFFKDNQINGLGFYERHRHAKIKGKKKAWQECGERDLN